MKGFLVGVGVLAGLGLAVAAVFLVISGLEYRGAEDAGVEPGPAPAGTVLGMEVGLWLFVLGLLGFVGAGALVLARLARKRKQPLLGISGIVTAAGLFMLAVCLLGSGLLFRAQSDDGFSQVILGMTVGVWVSCLGLAGFVTTWLVSLIRRENSMNSHP